MNEQVEDKKEDYDELRKRIDALVSLVREQNNQTGEYEQYENLLKNAFDVLRLELQMTIGKIEGSDFGSAEDIPEDYLKDLRRTIRAFKEILPE